MAIFLPKCKKKSQIRSITTPFPLFRLHVLVYKNCTMTTVLTEELAWRARLSRILAFISKLWRNLCKNNHIFFHNFTSIFTCILRYFIHHISLWKQLFISFLITKQGILNWCLLVDWSKYMKKFMIQIIIYLFWYTRYDKISYIYTLLKIYIFHQFKFLWMQQLI